MSNVVGLLVLVPALRIVRRLASPAIAPAVHALAAFFLVDRAREVCSAVPVLEQRVFLLEMVAGIVFLALAVRSERFLTNDETVTALAGRRGVVWVLWAQLSVFGVAVVAGALGYMQLARLLGGEVLASSYIALVLYAGVRVGQGLLVYLLRAWPVRHLFMVQHHGALLQRRGSQALRGLAVGTWAYFTLDALGLTSRIWSAGTVVLEARYVRGSFSLSLGDVAVFVLTIGAAFAVASVVRFVLQEDVYPRIWLPRGVSYAVSTLIRYGIILAGSSSRSSSSGSISIASRSWQARSAWESASVCRTPWQTSCRGSFSCWSAGSTSETRFRSATCREKSGRSAAAPARSGHGTAPRSSCRTQA